MILDNAGVNPVQHPAHVDEDAIISSLAGSAPADVVSALARAKADAVAPEYQDDIVVGCDSMLLLNGQLQGKPHTVEATISRWREQRGQTAELITGHAIGYKGTWVVDTVSTRIHFGDATDADIEVYARSGEPLECAGAFTLEALGGWFIDSIEGDQTSVIGLSLPLLRKAFYSFGINASDLWR